MGLWQWLKGAGGAAKGASARDERGASARDETAIGRAKQDWKEDGDRADQDYYHMPGATNPDRTDPPKLDGVKLPKRGKGQKQSVTRTKPGATSSGRSSRPGTRDAS